MLKLNKNIIYKAIIVASFALLIAAFCPKQAKAALQAADITVDYKQQLVVIKVNDNDELYYSMSVGGKNTEENIASLRQSGEYTPASGSKYKAFLVDLSTITASSDITFYAKYAKNDTAVSVIIKAQSILKAKFYGTLEEGTEGNAIKSAYSAYTYFNEDTGYIGFSVNNKTYSSLSSIEWRAGNSMMYHPMSELNLLMYQGYGTTLYFRINNGSEMPGKDVKVRIQKQANAPRVRIDGNKLTISLSSGMEYRYLTSSSTFSDWIQVADNTKRMNLGTALGIADGAIYTSLASTRIEVRYTGTAGKNVSKITSVYLDAAELPVSGSSGFEVTAVNELDISKGLKVYNYSKVEYQYAVINKADWTGCETVKDIIKSIDTSARSTETGYVAWKSLKAGKNARIGYSVYKDFKDSYVILYRIASIKEDTKTSAREFRIASVIRSIGLGTPTADVTSGTILIASGSSGTKTVNFTVDNGWTLYTSVNDGAASRNTVRKLAISYSEGTVATVKAYAINNETQEKSDTATFTYTFIADIENECYANSWGYTICKKKDGSSGDGWKAAYQAVYFAYRIYDENGIGYNKFGLTYSDMSLVIRMVTVDNPELLQATGRFSYTSTLVYLDYRDKDTMTRLLAECNTTVNTIKTNIINLYGANATTVQKVKVIHDYLVLAKEYKNSIMSQTMAGCLTDEYTPVCMSYAQAMSYVCECVGIQCITVFGDATNSSGSTESHAWNMINYGTSINYYTMKEIDQDGNDTSSDASSDTWYEMDVTWDDPLGASVDYIGYSYYNLTTTAMSSSHTRTYIDNYPEYPFGKCTGTAYSYANCISNNLFTRTN